MEGRSVTLRGFKADRACEGLHDGLGDAEPQACSAAAPRVRAVGLGELVEDMGPIFGGNAWPLVGDTDAYRGAPGLGEDPHRGLILGKLDGIGQQIGHDLPEAVRIDPHLGIVRPQILLQADQAL